ncbi:hypothetical protein [Pimelobacter simplex]|uniref:hypothetical protein n=1 Tax=Nocardioides simplex TaxID=2045 RepID=UPI00214FA29A|nr:hypothetical protein [Pimelobacter simplex]UUW92233.1 hypothetical protein M0M43_12345 [Pimelobacter simplex]UUW96060.1 hypothetical protein M0M48_00975 [Pimelobacter simplex]
MRVEALPGETQAAERLKQTALRDFGVVAADDTHDPRWDGFPSYRMAIDPDDAPVPFLLKYALNLVGCPAYGPGEKVAWWVNFTYRGERCSLAFQKFGLRLYLRTERPEEEALETQKQITKQLRSSMRTIERLIVTAAPDLLGKGAATVRNQHASLRRAYDYFRERAEQPVHIEDVDESGESPGGGTWRTFRSGQTEMQLNSFHDMVAAISAFLSLLEHDLVLALAFADFDPDEDDLTEMIGSRWGEKWDRIFGKEGDAGRYWQRLFDVVERWRNPYSHGGFEKGHGATIYLHTPGVNAAVPIGLTRVRESPIFSFIPAGETDISEVFALFDEIEAFLGKEHPEAVAWIGSGLDVRYDEDFRLELAHALQHDRFEQMLETHEYQHDIHVNMDFALPGLLQALGLD